MDQQLKERLVGATVLIVVGILFIPLLLDGPDEQAPVRVGLELPVPDSGKRTHTIRLDVPAERPATQASGSPVAPVAMSKSEAATEGGATESGPVEKSASKPEAKPPVAAASEPPATKSPATKSPATKSSATEPTATASAGGNGAATSSAQAVKNAGEWAVQVGSFSSEDNALRLQSQLKAAGFQTFRTRLVADGRSMHRVRVGPVADRSAAEALASRLGKAGYPGRVVATDD
jgi:DedD protein